MKLYKNLYRDCCMFEVVIKECYTLSPKGEVVESEQYEILHNKSKGFWRTWYSEEVNADTLDKDAIKTLFEELDMKDLKMLFKKYPSILDEYKEYIGELNTEDVIELFKKRKINDLDVLFELYPFLLDVYKSYTDGLCEKKKDNGMGIGIATGMVIGNMMD